jgi:chromosome segregation protein
MVKKQEELALSFEHKTVTLVSVETLSGQIEAKIKEAKNTRDIDFLLKTLDEVAELLSHFVDKNKDKVDMSLLSEAQKDIEKLRESKKQIDESLIKIKNKEGKLSFQYTALQNKIEKEKDSNRDAEKSVFRIMAESQEVRSRLHSLSVEEETLRLVREDFKRELTELGMMLGTHVLQFQSISLAHSLDEPRNTQEERRRKIEKIKIRLEDAGGTGETDVLKEYTEASERDAFLEKELGDLEKSAESLTELIADLDLRLSTEFKSGVDKINVQFKEYFAVMFGGGEAKLSVVTPPKRKKKEADDLFSDIEEAIEIPEEEVEEGIDIEVNLPKKKIKGLMMLSGGERALTSIALLFAVSQVNPPPFIVLDETDAALDEANSKKYGDMVENLSKYSQLILITHNRETMSRAGVLYGVTMGMGGGSKLLSVAFDEAVSIAK